MKAVAHLLEGSYLPLSGHMDRIKALPPSSMKTFLPSSRHMERITHRSMNKRAAVDDDNNHVSPPTPACHDKLLPLEEFPEKFEAGCVIRRSDDEVLLRLPRINSAERFRTCYTDGIVKAGCNNRKEQKTCIWPGNTSSWRQDESSGITWVGVHGMDSVCVVAKNEDMDATLLCHIFGKMPMHEVLFNFRKSAIVEIEDLADLFPSIGMREITYNMNKERQGVEPSSEIRGRFNHRIEKPFGVVSVIPDAYKSREGGGHEAPSIKYDETKAIEFLQDKVKSDTVFTVTETIQTAIAAFEQLFQKKFRCDEIKVSVLDRNDVVRDFNGYRIIQDLTDRQINEHLAVIKPGARD